MPAQLAYSQSNKRTPGRLGGSITLHKPMVAARNQAIRNEKPQCESREFALCHACIPSVPAACMCCTSRTTGSQIMPAHPAGWQVSQTGLAHALPAKHQTMQGSAGCPAVNIPTASLPAGAPPVAPSSCAAFSAARLESVDTAATYSCRSKLTRCLLMEGSHIARFVARDTLALSMPQADSMGCSKLVSSCYAADLLLECIRKTSSQKLLGCTAAHLCGWLQEARCHSWLLTCRSHWCTLPECPGCLKCWPPWLARDVDHQGWCTAPDPRKQVPPQLSPPAGSRWCAAPECPGTATC